MKEALTFRFRQMQDRHLGNVFPLRSEGSTYFCIKVDQWYNAGIVDEYQKLLKPSMSSLHLQFVQRLFLGIANTIPDRFLI